MSITTAVYFSLSVNVINVCVLCLDHTEAFLSAQPISEAHQAAKHFIQVICENIFSWCVVYLGPCGIKDQMLPI